MPKALHDKLANAARSKGLKGEKAAAYIYGTMQQIEKEGGLKASKRRKGKGVAKP
jgi:hypothetical protein